MDFYERLVDTLLENGIEPVPTLFHWELPIALDDRGGWLNPDVADWFADYASAMYGARRRVKKWTTLNEPWVVADGGYLHGAQLRATRISTRRRSRRIICCARTARRSGLSR